MIYALWRLGQAKPMAYFSSKESAIKAKEYLTGYVMVYKVSQ